MTQPRVRAACRWEPKVTVDEGLYYTIAYFRDELALQAAPGVDDADAAAKYTRRDAMPLWVATSVNALLTDKEKGLVD